MQTVKTGDPKKIKELWWHGLEVSCPCGFTGILEPGDDVSFDTLNGKPVNVKIKCPTKDCTKFAVHHRDFQRA